MGFKAKWLEEHAVWTSLASCKEALPEARERAQEEEAEDALDRISRLEDVVSAAERTLTSTDPALLPENRLSNLQSHLNQLRNHVSNYSDSGNSGLLNENNAQQSADHILTDIGILWRPVAPTDVSTLQDRIISFKKSVGQHRHYLLKDLKNAREKVNKLDTELETRLNELSQKVEAELNDVDQQADAARQQLEQQTENHLAELAKEIEQYKSNLEQQKQRIDSTVENFQSQFSESQESRRESFQQAQESRSDEFEALRQETREKLEEALTDLTSIAEDKHEELEGYREEAEELVGVVAGTTLTGGFKETADEEEKYANRWRVTAVVAILAIIGVGAWALATATTTEGASFSWSQFASKLTLTAPLFLLTGYAMKEAGRHRTSQRRNRRLQLELASIGPYLERLDTQKRQAIKEDLVKRWFGQSVNHGENEDDNVTAQDLLEVLRDAFSHASRWMPGN